MLFRSNEKALEDAKGIVKRAKEREANGLRLLPRVIEQKNNRTTAELEQEHRDAQKLGRWKNILRKKGKGKCSNEVRYYLDTNLPGWRDDFDKKALEDAKGIVKRANEREVNGSNLLPKQVYKKIRTTNELKQEHNDAIKLGHLKQVLKGKGKGRCSNEVRDYLDINLPGSKGDVGYPGSNGYLGCAGYTGSRGYTGSQGIQGTTGYNGSGGYSGSRGYTGSKGDIGALGYTGSKGDSGTAGAIGYTGSLGYTGSIGNTGYDGSLGYTAETSVIFSLRLWITSRAF